MEVIERLERGVAYQWDGTLEEFVAKLGYPSYTIEVYSDGATYTYIDGYYYKPGDWAVKEEGESHWKVYDPERFAIKWEPVG